LVLTLAVAVIPIAVVSYLVHPPDAANAWRDMIHPAPAPAPAGHEMDVLRQFLQRYVTPSSVLVVLASVIALTIANTACVIVAVAGYRGEAASISQAFRLSASRVVAQVISAALFAGLFLALVIGMVLVSIPITGIIAALIAVSNGVGLVIGVVIGLIMVLTLFAFIGMLLLAWELSFISIAVEESHPVRAAGRALQRTFSQAIFIRSLVVGLVLIVLYLVFGFMATAVESITANITHINALAAVIDAVIDLLFGGLLTCYYVAYWFDLRVRREGYDLALAAEAPA
jgi:hypothetical protein